MFSHNSHVTLYFCRKQQHFNPQKFVMRSSPCKHNRTCTDEKQMQNMLYSQPTVILALMQCNSDWTHLPACIKKHTSSRPLGYLSCNVKQFVVLLFGILHQYSNVRPFLCTGVLLISLPFGVLHDVYQDWYFFRTKYLQRHTKISL